MTVDAVVPALFDLVTDRVAVGRAPMCEDDVRAIAAEFSHVLEVRAEHSDAEAFRRYAPDVVYRWWPARDDGRPKLGDWFGVVVAFAREALASGRLLVYCAAGINRAPSAVYAILRSIEGLDADDALELVRRARPIAVARYVADADRYLDGNDVEPIDVRLGDATFAMRGASTVIEAVRDRLREPACCRVALQALFGDQADDVASLGLTVADVEDLVGALEPADAGSVAACALCEAAAATRRYVDAPRWWVADCATCGVPMVVWRDHGIDPPDDEHVGMLLALDGAAADRYPAERWIIDQRRRSIPDHWHAHARPIVGAPAGAWSDTRARLRRLAVTSGGQRIDDRHGWRCWAIDADGVLVSDERGVPWLERRQTAVCDTDRSWWPELRAGAPCVDAPGPECLCGLSFFATLDDVADVYGTAAPIGRALAWACITTDGRVERDQALLGQTWRCASAQLVAVVVAPDLEHHAEALEQRYGVPVHGAHDATAAAFLAAARAAGLPAIDRPARPAGLDADTLDVLGGGARRTFGIGRTLVAFVPGRTPIDAQAGGYATDTPGARFTWYEPGVDALAFTPHDCDRILDAIDVDAVGAYGRPSGRILSDGPGRWVWDRIAEIFTAANVAWWRLAFDELRGVAVNTYRPGDGLPWHTDATPLDGTYRLSLVAMLTDPDRYEGGQLEFHHDDEPTRLPPGQTRGIVAVYPSTLLHRVTPVTAGERRVLVAFAHARR